MDSTNSALRNLLFFVIALVIIAILSNFWVASQIDRNTQELASLRLLMAKQMMGNALTQAEELQKRMDALNQSAAGIDAKMKQAQEEMDAKLRKAQDDFVARMNVELPKTMDNYVKSRAPLIQKQLEQRGVQLPKP
jgi:H2-forming N5,N10-methylenetetrahydromethanopterin dehydrogenase-like enzyme